MFSNIVFKKVFIAVSVGALFSLGAVSATKGSAAEPVGDGASAENIIGGDVLGGDLVRDEDWKVDPDATKVVYDSPRVGSISKSHATDLEIIAKDSGQDVERLMAANEGVDIFAELLDQIRDGYPDMFVVEKWEQSVPPSGTITFNAEPSEKIKKLIKDSGVLVNVKVEPQALSHAEREKLSSTVADQLAELSEISSFSAGIDPITREIEVNVTSKSVSAEKVAAVVNQASGGKLPVKVTMLGDKPAATVEYGGGAEYNSTVTLVGSGNWTVFTQ